MFRAVNKNSADDEQINTLTFAEFKSLLVLTSLFMNSEFSKISGAQNQSGKVFIY